MPESRKTMSALQYASKAAEVENLLCSCHRQKCQAMRRFVIKIIHFKFSKKLLKNMINIWLYLFHQRDMSIRKAHCKRNFENCSEVTFTYFKKKKEKKKTNL